MTQENPYVRKTQDEYVLQGRYGHGWEDLTAESSWREIRARRREYQENEPGTPLKIVTRRIPLLENPADIGMWTGIAALGALFLIVATRKKKPVQEPVTMLPARNVVSR